MYISIENFVINGKNLADILANHKKWLAEPVGKETHEKADLSGANLRNADLSGANLSGANLSGAKNLLNPATWLAKNFEYDDLGYIVYKRIGVTLYNAPDYWSIAAGKTIEEVVSPLPTNDCGCGVNFGTLDWVKNNYQDADIWRCRISWTDLPGVVVPYNTDGKARCSRLELLEKVFPKEVEE